jgi:EmrB/QacA subfamily drug resistance transporter
MPVDALTPAKTPPSGASVGAIKAILPWLVAVAFFMESLDTTILNTGVPVISKALGVSALSMKAVLASYTLSLAVFIPISGWMADRFGTRRVFASAIGLFTLGSFLCGLTSDLHVLVLCRILQGCGGSMMVPVGRLTLVKTFPKSELVRAMSFVAIPGLVGPMVGPFVGGLIVSYLHWRDIFFINIPIGIAGLVMVYLHLPDYRVAKVHPLDVEGLILFGSGLALLSYVLEVFGEHALSAGEVLGLLALSLVLLAGYGLHARRMLYPLLEMSLFRIRTFAAAVGGSFITRLGAGGAPFLLPLLYQVGLGLTPVQSGLLSRDAGVQHPVAGPDADAVRHDWARNAYVVDCGAGLRLRHPDVHSVHLHEHPGVRRRARGSVQRRQLHLQHPAATVDELRRGGGRPDHGVFHSRQPASEPGEHDPRTA